MTDRELLEFAAKAAALHTRWIGASLCHFVVDDGLDEGWWGPLTDDGDALRLAVKLRMNIVITTMGVSARCETAPSKWADEYCAAGSDYEAATRRAVVRAAAEIGRAMP